MGLFGGKENAFNKPNANGFTLADALYGWGGMLAGNDNAIQEMGKNIEARKKLTQQQAMQQKLAGLFGGQQSLAQRGTGSVGNPGEMGGVTNGQLPSVRSAAPVLAELMAGGMDISDAIALLDKAAPQVKYERGMRFDERDPKSAPAFVPDMDKGQMPLFDANGQIVAVRNMDGSVAAAAEMAGAVKGAEAKAQAPYEFVNTPTPTGAPQVMSKQAAAGGVFIGQAPTDAKAAMAATEGAIDLPSAQRTAQNALDVIGQIRTHPGRDKRLGMWATVPAIPGTPGKDFDELVGQAKGQVFLQAFESLKGAGQITEMEGKAATAASARLNQAQTPEGFNNALDDLEKIIQSGVKRAEQRAGSHGGPPPAPPAGQRRSGSVYNTPRGPMTWTGTGWLPAN